MSANYEELLGFVRTASAGLDRTASLATLVENLERAVPELSAAEAPRSQTSNIVTEPSQASSGIMGMISQISTLKRKEHIVDGAIERTGTLTNPCRTELLWQRLFGRSSRRSHRMQNVSRSCSSNNPASPTWPSKPKRLLPRLPR